MQAFSKAVPAILTAVGSLQTAECTGFVKQDFPLFGISWRGLLHRSHDITSVTLIKTMLQYWLCTLWLQFCEEELLWTASTFISWHWPGVVVLLSNCYCSYIYSPYMRKISAALSSTCPFFSFSRTSWATVSLLHFPLALENVLLFSGHTGIPKSPSSHQQNHSSDMLKEGERNWYFLVKQSKIEMSSFFT